MSDYSATFPTQRPVFSQDFAQSGKIDPRATFTRASTANVFDGAKHLSSENLIDYSSDISQSSWTKDGVTETGGQTAPDGGTDAYKLTENSATSHHRIYKLISTDSGAITVSAYLKYIGRQWVRFRLTNSSGQDRFVWFDIQNGVVGTAQSGYSNVSITASGNGFYKASATLSSSVASGGGHHLVIAGGGADNSSSTYAGSGADSFAVWGIQVSSTGETVLNETSGSIHREYASSLVSKANNIGRFEVGVDGQSEGILIESQSTNLATYGSDLTNAAWNPLSAFIGGTAVGPDGTLSAVKLVASAGSSLYPRFRRLSFLTDTTQTFSIYVKPLEFQHLIISADGSASCIVQYNLSGSGAITSATGATGAVEQCGNGWFRVSFSYTTVPNAHLAITMQSSTTYQTETGNGYDGMLFALAQLENQSFASSFIGTTSSTATRAADSLSVVDSSLFDNGSGALAAEYDMFAASETSYLLHIEKSSGGTNGGGILVTNRYLGVENNYLDLNNTTSNAFHKVAASWETGSQKMSRDGGAASEDTSTVIPSGTDKLFIGVRQDGGEPVNGHIKRLAIYSEPLSSTNLQALTS